MPRNLRVYINRILSSSIGSRLVKGAFWSLTGALISRGLMLLASIFVARMLGRDVYGEYGMIRSTVTMFAVFAGFSLGMTATKYVAQLRYTDPERTGRIMALSGVFAVITGGIITIAVVVCAPWIAVKTINAPHLVGELRLAAVILFFGALNGAQTGALAGFEAFRSIARVNLLVGLSSFPLLVGGAYFGGLRGSVWALIVNIVINWALNNLAIRNECKKFKVPFLLKGCLSEWRTLVGFSLPAALGGFMVSPVVWICNAVLVNMPQGYGQMALFDAANQWRIGILFIPSTIGQIVLPMLSDYHHLEDQASFRFILKINLYVNAGAALAIALPVAALSPWIMKSYGAGFVGGAWVLIILSASTIVSAVNNVIGQAIVSAGKMWLGLFFNTLWAISMVVVSYICIKRGYGAIGLATAYLFAYLLHSLWQGIYVFCKPKWTDQPGLASVDGISAK